MDKTDTGKSMNDKKNIDVGRLSSHFAELPDPRKQDLFNNLPIGCGLCHFAEGFICTDMISDGLFQIPYLTPALLQDKLGKHFREAVYVPDQEVMLAEYERVKDKPDAVGSVDFRTIGTDGVLHWLNFKFRRAYQDQGIQYYYDTFYDIDRQKKSEQEMFKFWQMYDEAALAAKVAVWTYDIETRRASMMPSYYTRQIIGKLGLPAEVENFPGAILSFVVEADKHKYREAYRQIEDGADTAACEFIIRLPGDEEPKHMHMGLKRINDRQGKLITVHGYVQDITALTELRGKYSRIYRHLENPEGYGSFHLNLSRNWCGDGRRGKSKLPAVLKLERTKTVDGFLHDCASIIADDERRAAFCRHFSRESLLKKFAEGTDRISFEFPVTYEDGAEYWREGVLALQKNPDTAEVEAVAYALDIDERKTYEAILDELSGKVYNFVSLLDLHTNQVTEYGDYGRSYVTEQKLSKADYTPAMITALRNFVPPDKLDEAIRLHSIDTIKAKLAAAPVYEIVLPTRDNHVFGWRISYLGSNQHKVLILRRDVTNIVAKEHKLMEDMAAAKLAADVANQAKSNFLNNMSHDLRTPLNGILGFTALALEEKDVQKKQAYLERIQTSGQLLEALVNDTLELSRIESGKLVLKPELVDGRDFWSSLVNALIPAAEMKGIRLDTEPEQYPTEMIKVDQLQVKKVLLNLISNAVKYTPAGGTVKVTVQALQDDERGYTRRLTVEDTGIGMIKEFMERMYEPFSQELRPGRENIIGTGLGLAIVKRIVDFMGGCISVQSKVGHGTRFIVDLPIEHWAKKPEDVARKQEEMDFIEKEILTKLCDKKVLVCEDNYLNAEIATLILKDKRMDVDWAKDGKQGVKAFADSMPGYYDFILMDVRMPVMDGYVAAGRIRHLQRKDAETVPIIALSANAFEDDMREAEKAGMNDYVTKPINPHHLFSVMAKYVE